MWIETEINKKYWISIVLSFFYVTSSLAAEAPGKPGETPYWSSAQKTAVGTSYEAYDEEEKYSGLSK